MKVFALLTLLFPIILAVQFFNHTGFCYSKGRYLSEIELMDQRLFGEEAHTFSNEEKETKAKTELSHLHWNLSYIDYPACCRIHKGYPLLSKLGDFTNKTFIGRYTYHLVILFPAKESKKGRSPYEELIVTLDACGMPGKDFTGIDISESSYSSTLERNKKYWQSRGLLPETENSAP